MNVALTPLPPSAPPAAEADEFLTDALAGLSGRPKRLSAKYFYDAAGSALFEEITRLPEYYPTRTELKILAEHGAEIARLIPPGAALVEFGSGSATKIRLLLEQAPQLGLYVPVDVSREFLLAEAEALAADYPDLPIAPVEADFTKPFLLPDEAAGRSLAGFFPGSTIGNFDPHLAQGFLGQARAVLGSGSVLIVGVDLEKDRARLEAAYDDAAGVTARFNLNLLARMNRELGADFDLSRFQHRALFNAALHRVEMHLASTIAQNVRIGGDVIAFAAGETIHTENSYKYTVDSFSRLAEGAGWHSEQVWVDADNLFSVHALRN